MRRIKARWIAKRPMPQWWRTLRSLDACGSALLWAQQFDTLEEAWHSCHDGRWLEWLSHNVYGICDGGHCKITYQQLGLGELRFTMETADFCLLYADRIRERIPFSLVERMWGRLDAS